MGEPCNCGAPVAPKVPGPWLVGDLIEAVCVACGAEGLIECMPRGTGPRRLNEDGMSVRREPEPKP